MIHKVATMLLPFGGHITTLHSAFIQPFPIFEERDKVTYSKEIF